MAFAIRLSLLLAFFLPAVVFGQIRQAAPVREADAVCGKCHGAILQSYLATPMANASGLAVERLLPGTYKHPSSRVTYSISKLSGQAFLQYALPTTPPITGSERLEYFLGSGHLGLTYLYQKNGYWLESPVAYYQKMNAYGMKPGLENAKEMPAALLLNPSCLRCHMSGVQKQVAGTDNLYRQLPFLQTHCRRQSGQTLC